MSLNLIRKNSGSPFQLQRSMVDQGGSGGAYESGGFDPSNVYNNDAANAAIESFGKVVGASLASRTEGDANEANEAKVKRLQNKGAKLVDKSKNSSGDKQIKIDKKIDKIASRIDNTNQKISKYKESINPASKASITPMSGSLANPEKNTTSKPFASKGIDVNNKKELKINGKLKINE